MRGRGDTYVRIHSLASHTHRSKEEWVWLARTHRACTSVSDAASMFISDVAARFDTASIFTDVAAARFDTASIFTDVAAARFGTASIFSICRCQNVGGHVH